MIQVVTSDATAFVSAPLPISTGTQLSVGTASGQAVVWVKTAADGGPFTATAGAIVVNQFDSSPTGKFNITLNGIAKAADTVGPSFTADGAIYGNWAQPN